MPAYRQRGRRHASTGPHNAAPSRRSHRSGSIGALTALLLVAGVPFAHAAPAPSAPEAPSSLAGLTHASTSPTVTVSGISGAGPSRPAAMIGTTGIVSKPASRPTLRYGMTNAHVKAVQTQLKVTPRSGWFGPKTKAAVQRFQRNHKLRATGVVDARTWQALDEAKARTARIQARASRGAPRAALSVSPGVQALQVAPKYAGTPYRWGGTSPRGFDCSGYVSYVFKKVGVQLPRTSGAIRSAVPRISASQRQPGDLVFVHKGGRVSHVAIYAGNGRWWEASRPGKPVGLHKAWTSSVSYGRVGA